MSTVHIPEKAVTLMESSFGVDRHTALQMLAGPQVYEALKEAAEEIRKWVEIVNDVTPERDSVAWQQYAAVSPQVQRILTAIRAAEGRGCWDVEL